MKKFNQNDFIDRLSQGVMDSEEFDGIMDCEENINSKGRNNTKEHDKHWKNVRDVFNAAHKKDSILGADKLMQLDEDFLKNDINLSGFFSRLKKAPISDEVFEKFKNSDKASSEFNEFKQNGDTNNNRKIPLYNKIRECVNNIYEGKLNMEEKFKRYLKDYTILTGVTPYVQALKLEDSVYQSIRDVIKGNDFYEIDNIVLFLERYQSIQGIIPNKRNTNGNGGDNGYLSAALKKYKLFLQYLEVVKQMDLYDENPEDFPINGNVRWYFQIKDRNNKYPIKATCKNIIDELEIGDNEGNATTDATKAQLQHIFKKNMEFHDLDNDNEGSIMSNVLEKEVNLLRYKKQIILQGSPGTGKTRLAKEIAEQIAPDNYKLIQFHPAYTYEDFVRGVVAETGKNGISYEVQNKVLAEMAENAQNKPEKDFVLIIDEINRANLSSVLGELIYALEYRGEAVESMYEYKGSRDKGSRKIILPKNLYIIGTMNTADRSVGYIDYAIRRRFAFVNVPTNRSVIEEKYPDNLPLFDEIKKLFDEKLSEEFEKDDVMIGHSYFLKDGLKMALEYEIKPILHEYRKDGVLVDREDKIKDKIEALKTED